MKTKFFTVALALCFAISVWANQPIDSATESETTAEASAETEAGYQTKSPISYKVYKQKYFNDYSIDFYNNTRQTLEVEYVYADPNSRTGWITNYVRVPGGGSNKSNAAGPYGQVKILDVYEP